METTNSSENPQRRVEDRKTNETINWEAPGAPAVPLSPAASERANSPIRYVASLLVNSEGASVFTTPDAARLPHGHYLLSAGAHPIAVGSAATSGDAPTDSRDMLIAEAVRNECLSAAHEADPKHEIRRIDLSAVVARIERAAAPAFKDAEELAAWLDSLHESDASGTVSNRKWEPAQRAAAAIRAAAPAQTGAKEFRAAIRDAVITCGHEIEDESVTLYRDPKFPGGALKQLLDRIELAAAPGPATASGDELPPLPEPAHSRMAPDFTADQMRDYARAAVSAATKPTADLHHAIMAMECKATWSQFANSTDFAKHKAGYHEAKLDAAELVQSLLATKPAAAPAVPEGWKRALHAAVCAIYFDDSSDFRSSLGTVVRHLDAELAGELLGNPKAAYDKACAMLEATPAASTPATEQAKSEPKNGQEGYVCPAGKAQAESDSSHVMPPFAAPAGHQPACLTDDELDAMFMPLMPALPAKYALRIYGREVEVEVASRCRAQGGATNDTSSGNSAASTTGAAQTAEQVRDAALEEAAELVKGCDDRATLRGIACAIRALKRPTPTHSSEAGDAPSEEGAGN